MLVNEKESQVNKFSQKSNKVLIELNQVSKHYPNTIALDNISFQIHKGEIFCLIGPNGAGKSTLVKLITGQLKQTSGKIKVKEKDPYGERKSLFGVFGLVPQELALYNELTGFENLEFHARLYNMSKSEITPKVDKLLKIAGLFERKNDRVRTYSGGMKRRLQLIRALLHEPEILILDEPTLGVDVQTRSAIHEYILEVAKQGMTILVTTNYMEEAERLAENIVILDTKVIEGPDRLREIQERVFPNTIFEFKATRKSLTSDFYNQFLTQELNGQILMEKKLSETYSFFQIMFESNIIEEIIEKFLAYTKSHNIPIEEFVLKKPTLEDIFLKLTGKEFRE
ncbi:MAG: ABC transporter ATP-binding protein [Promethearchaeota archaeon]